LSKKTRIIEIKPKKPLILASQSEARKKILQKARIKFSVKPSNVNESEIKDKLRGKSLDKVAKKLAQAKALKISQQYPDSYVIGADQICSLENKLFDKPGNFENAIYQLTKLSGKTHKQYTAVCIFHQEKIFWSKIEIATLKMRKLTKSEIVNYVKIDKPYNSCGSYKFESFGFHLFSKIEGSNDTIQGLPLIPLLNVLKKHNIYSI